MYGVVTRDPAALADPRFERAFYEVKAVTGRRAEPTTQAVNMVSCHGDSSAPDALVPLDDEGRSATRDRKYFDWGYVCPTHPDYREDLLGLVETCAATNADVRLDDVGFPRPEYCHCDRCVELYEASAYADRFAWRESVITAFLAAARDRVPGRLHLTVYPDPYPNHLSRRAGIDVAAIEEYVDEFVIPIYDMAYATTYWIEVIASGFADALTRPFSVELYAVGVELDNLVHAAEVADAYARDVHFAYHAETARAAIARLAEDAS